MKETRYLYGNLDAVVFETQKSVARAKIEACNKLLDQLLKAPYEARDWDRVNDVVKARRFNEELLKEVE